jgi:hypothetical protein
MGGGLAPDLRQPEHQVEEDCRVRHLRGQRVERQTVEVTDQHGQIRDVDRVIPIVEGDRRRRGFHGARTQHAVARGVHRVERNQGARRAVLVLRVPLEPSHTVRGLERVARRNGVPTLDHTLGRVRLGMQVNQACLVNLRNRDVRRGAGETKDLVGDRHDCSPPFARL